MFCHRLLKNLISILLITLALTACVSSLNEDQNHLLPTTPAIEVDDQHSWSETHPDGNIIQNGDFDEDILEWEIPYGRLVHSDQIYFEPPGGALAITNDTGGSLGFRTSFGQCIDLRGFLDYATKQTSEIKLIIEAALRTDPSITEVTLNGIFVDDYRCGTGHLESFERIDLEGNQDWIVVSSSLPVPEGARSLHIFINAVGKDDTARVFIDEVKLYAPEMVILEKEN